MDTERGLISEKRENNSQTRTPRKCFSHSVATVTRKTLSHKPTFETRYSGYGGEREVSDVVSAVMHLVVNTRS